MVAPAAPANRRRQRRVLARERAGQSVSDVRRSYTPALHTILRLKQDLISAVEGELGPRELLPQLAVIGQAQVLKLLLHDAPNLRTLVRVALAALIGLSRKLHVVHEQP